MAALAEVMERLAGDIRLVDRERLDDDTSSAKEHIALTDGIRSDLGFDNDGEFKEIRGANCATVRIMNDACVKGCFRLAKEDRSEGRRIDDHLGRPRSS